MSSRSECSRPRFVLTMAEQREDNHMPRATSLIGLEFFINILDMS